MQLVIGNKNYSTWSLRPWLLLKAFGIEFDEHWVSLQEPNLTKRLRAISDAARVPVLNDGDLSVWDSLAICEYINEVYLKGAALPNDIVDRALARSICAEMHAGFSALRTEMPMNIRAVRDIVMTEQCKRDLVRIDEIWSTYSRKNNDGEWRLFGSFGIADCMFAPVVMRFTTYRPELSDHSRCYMESMLRHPALKHWVADALRENEVVDVDEVGIDRLNET